MSDQKSAAALLAEARKASEEIQQQKATLQSLIDEAREARKNIDSEALLAHNAKQACENHATDIARFKGTVEADATNLATVKQQAAESLAAINASRASCDEDRQFIATSRRTAEEKVSEIVDQSAKALSRASDIDVHRIQIEEAKQQAQSLLTQAASAQEKAEGAALRTEKAEDKANGHYSSVVSRQEAIAKIAETATELSEAIQAQDRDCAAAVMRLTESDSRNQELEKKLHQFLQDMDALKKKAEDLLPGFTSAGLAHSFNEQRKRFAIPQRNWLRVFL
jgi:chromosome segregation ATPase